jgi:iron only hydrogenase large subunit-like protein
MTTTTTNNYAVLLGDLNDFISPGTACVNPVFATPVPALALPSISIGNDDNSRSTASKKKAQISLSDCLACSGCVTSAETVLLQQQSLDKFAQETQAIQLSSSPFLAAVVTISPQSRASLAARFNLSLAETHQRISHVLKTKFAVNQVINATALAQDLSLLEVANEFVTKFQSHKESLPLLTSACPGWVCYVEKSQPAMLAHLSHVKSAQQISGALVKQILSTKLGLLPRQIYHAAVMPCPDKKLEAARVDFQSPDFTDVDCVLTTNELFDLIGDDLMETIFTTTTDDVCVSPEEPFAGGSGGYLAYVFRYAAWHLFKVLVPPGPLPFRQGRNSDVWHLALEVNGETVLRFGACYGFRNVQEVVRKTKRQTLALDFVEVMACPSGCANGGGQIPNGLPGTKQLLDQGVIYRAPHDNPELDLFYRQHLAGNGPGSQAARLLLHTSFREVQKLETDEAVVARGW